jgi:hypothetical protein
LFVVDDFFDKALSEKQRGIATQSNEEKDETRVTAVSRYLPVVILANTFLKQFHVLNQMG